jgi:hypothetical protein
MSLRREYPRSTKIRLMATQVVIRQPQPHEDDSVRALIETVATETFTDLFAPNPVPLKFEDDDWRLTWVAASDTNILGVMLTNQEWVSDLWYSVSTAGKGSEAICSREVNWR